MMYIKGWVCSNLSHLKSSRNPRNHKISTYQQLSRFRKAQVANMKPVITFLLLICAASACGDHAWRCVSPDSGGVDDDDQVTRECATKFGNPDECWCYHRAEQYSDFSSSAHLWAVDGFKACCAEAKRNGRNFAAREC